MGLFRRGAAFLAPAIQRLALAFVERPARSKPIAAARSSLAKRADDPAVVLDG
jgi:hypothetical protein